ncbi:MAG: NAD-dependent epimerase/dehydratase family protein [Thermoguttaceae bacterium]|jgi:nucleoside-diphosphate-sugar epimerase
MAKVLITGANGFIGSHLAAALVQRGDQVTCLVRKTSRLERLQTEGMTLAYGDVTDPGSLRAPLAGQDFVFHVAGCTSALDPQLMYQVNETGVRSVLTVCAEQPKPPVVVTVSSLAAAGPSPRGRLRIPEDPLCPVSHYGFSKRAGEKVAEEFADRVPITVVRPAIVFGEGDPVSLELFRIPAQFRAHLVPGYLPSQFSLIHVADLVELMILAAERGRRLAASGNDAKAAGTEGYYFAVCPEHPTYHQLGALVGRALGHWVAVLPFPTALVWLAATANEVLGRLRGQPLYLALDKAREATAGSWACTHQPVIDDLGLTFPVPLVDRMRQTIEWNRERGWL